jgi:hypothetical protein
MMTFKELTGIILILLSVGLIYMILSKVRRIRNGQDKILEDKYQEMLQLLKDRDQPITPSLLQSYGFKIYDTKDVNYAVNGSISMTQKEGYWETEIQAPGRILWRDTHETIGQLEVFCEKHNLKITKQEDND